jgi:hypothetical protein
MDMTLITGTVSGLKAASDIAKSFLDIKKLSDINGKVVELQSVILSAQSSAIEANSAQFAMIEDIRALKEEITRMKEWDREKQRYVLVSPWDGFFAYATKKDSAGVEPPHWICTKCYEKGMKSILDQRRRNALGFWYCVCPVCNSQNDSPFNKACAPLYAE